MKGFQFENWDEFVAHYDPKILNQAMNSAIRKSLMETRTEISKNIRKVYNVKARDIGATVTLKKLSYIPPEYMLDYFGYRVSLRNYAARAKMVESRRGARKGVTVRVKKKRRLVKGGFFGPRGYPVYLRTGVWKNGKEQIQKHSGLAIPQMIQGKDQLRLAYDFMGKRMPPIFAREVRFYQKRAEGKV